MQVKQPEPRKAKLAPADDVQTTKVDSRLQSSDSLQWSSLAHALQLDALAKQVAINSVVQSWQDNQLKLAYLPELEVMIKPEIKQQIKQAITASVGVSLTLEFISVPALDTETPHQAKLRLQEQERQAAIQSIRQDPVVQQLHSVFGAELIEQSVQKVKG